MLREGDCVCVCERVCVHVCCPTANYTHPTAVKYKVIKSIVQEPQRLQYSSDYERRRCSTVAS